MIQKSITTDLTLRDLFAMNAPPMPEAFIRFKLGEEYEEDALIKQSKNYLVELDAEWRYQHADAMLKARCVKSRVPAASREPNVLSQEQ